MPNYETTANILEMVRLLEHTHSGALPVNTIADRFEVNRRTVIRWLLSLEEHWRNEDDKPIIQREHRNNEAWAVLRRDRASLSANIYQYAATFAATKHLEAGGATLLSDSAKDVLERVEKGLSTKEQGAIRRVMQSFHYVPFAPKNSATSEDTLDALIRALLRRYPVQLHYTSAAGRSSEQRFEPWSLVMYRDGFYILGRVETKEALRLYAVERITQITIDSSTTFSVPTDFDPSTEFSPNLGIWRSGALPTPVVIAFQDHAEAAIRSRDWPGLKMLCRGTDGRLRLEMNVPITPEIISWVLNWGAAAEVLEPPALRAKIQEQLHRAYRQYASEVDSECLSTRTDC